MSRSKVKGSSVSELPNDVEDTKQSDFPDTRPNFLGTLCMYCNSFKHTHFFFINFESEPKRTRSRSTCRNSRSGGVSRRAAVSRSKVKGTSISELPNDVDDTEQSDFPDTRPDFSGTCSVILYVFLGTLPHLFV